MAGESPDKSERERSSGETTEDAGSVPAARRQDPREAYAAAADTGPAGEPEAAAGVPEGADGAAEPDSAAASDGAERDGPGSGNSRQDADAADAPADDSGDARLRAAVAAWVSSADDDQSGQDGQDDQDAGPGTQSSDAPADSGSGAEAPADDSPPGGGEDGAVDGANSDLPVRPRGAATEPGTDSAAKPAPDTATTMFGVRPDVLEPTDETSAAARAERMTAAFFGSSRKPGEQDSVAEATSPEGVGADSAADSPLDTSADVAPDQTPGEARDVTEQAPAGPDEPASAPEERDDDGDAVDAPADDEELPGDDTPADTPADTASDSATDPDPDLDAPDAAGEELPGKDRRTTASGAVAASAAKTDEENPGGPAAQRDHATTALRLPREDGDEDTPSGETTAVVTPAEKPADKGEDEDKGKDEDTSDGDGENGGSGEGGSRFVPLRSTDAPRTPDGAGTRRPLPDAQTSSTGTPASVISGVGGEQERTKQQPAPEPPPLELLAQLTNTPPPPETPLRTAVRRVKIWTPLVLLLAIVFVIVQAVRPLPEPTLTLTEQATYTFDGGEPSLPWPTEGQAYVEVSGLGVLGSYGEQKAVPIGSVAKTMTAYLVLQKSPLKEGADGPKITIDQKAEDDGKRGAGNGDESVLPSVEKGDKITQRDALSALMIPSANNIARLLARWHSGSEAAFVEEMNETAEELGMENTKYTDPSGLEETTVSTAKDQVQLGKKAMEIPALVEITRQPFWKDPFSGEQMRNWNTVVSSAGAIGIKTGTTTVAGGNLLFAGYEEIGDTRQLVVGAVLGQHKPPIIDTANAVSDKLLTAAEGTLTAEKIVQKGDVVGYVDDGLGGRTPVVATEDVAAVGWGGVEVDLALEPLKDMPHTAPTGKRVGTLTVGGGPGQVEVPVALEQDLPEPAFGDKLTRIL
ncbi:D-alanyl-D-alanine carboxypeptidase [Streptomyces sp. RKND-216]|uniref:serine hydrolase n=1 Tax=Streptomyces sp. RKND-216 TaxID=2562581 RepID=UPI00109DCD04|nr:serine hydrolase [Streptomyces sp. RKND-216]THA25911.1 D-alanyl-D-alanine carboxypeptidase [Streptomyces sp. RKND-216]